MSTWETVIKDCSALTDAELGEMADLSQRRGGGWEAGLLSKQVEEWVLVTQLFDDGALLGFAFATLERIGGTPSLLFGPGFVVDDDGLLESLMSAHYHKARMAFPDEDVVCAMRAVDSGPFRALGALTDLRPWPNARLNGEERAWGRRLAKRFAVEHFDDRTCEALTSKDPLAFDVGLPGPAEVEPLLGVTSENGGHLICWGWALAEFLDDYVALPLQ